ncbi:hypothetical protein [Pseudonocardia sp. TMWB2A]|uniref:hypothetical protein n=1 Tax=Pseudonocardia sp. TMWB2A TaxID=687430 RepID=UPI00307EA4E7
MGEISRINKQIEPSYILAIITSKTGTKKKRRRKALRFSFIPEGQISGAMDKK